MENENIKPIDIWIEPIQAKRPIIIPPQEKRYNCLCVSHEITEILLKDVQLNFSPLEKLEYDEILVIPVNRIRIITSNTSTKDFYTRNYEGLVQYFWVRTGIHCIFEIL